MPLPGPLTPALLPAALCSNLGLISSLARSVGDLPVVVLCACATRKDAHSPWAGKHGHMKQTSVTSALLSEYVEGPAKLSMDPDSCDMEYGWDIGGRAAFSIRVGLASTRREESEGAGFVLDCELVMLFLAFPLAYGSQRRRARDRCLRAGREEFPA
ncbi:hypothetical protein BJ912DRAFT_1079116 [Pholiota molesta]|nr:hypothetical protein BJ912DRAFT_1079116 [Pholiota molesta]